MKGAFIDQLVYSLGKIGMKSAYETHALRRGASILDVVASSPTPPAAAFLLPLHFFRKNSACRKVRRTGCF